VLGGVIFFVVDGWGVLCLTVEGVWLFVVLFVFFWIVCVVSFGSVVF